MSTDKPEEKKELTEAKKPPETTAKEAVIGATPQQDRWKLMEQAHYLEQDESATGLFRDPAGSTGKFGIDGLEDEAPKKIAYDLKDAQRDLARVVKHAEALNPERAMWPHRGEEDKLVDYAAASQAFFLAGLDRYPHVSKNLIAAAIRNEQHYYKATDSAQDDEVRKKGTVTNPDGTENTSASIGPAQIQIGKIRELVNAVQPGSNLPKYPFLSHLKTNPTKEALEPRNAALLVAAYFADSAEKFKSMGIDVNSQTLSYTYNPDVFKVNGQYECPSSVQMKAEHQLPPAIRPHRESVWNPTNTEILRCSTHVKNVNEQLKLIQEHHKN